MLSVNPGSEEVEDVGFEQAYNNILHYINDCEIELFIQSANCVPEENGRYQFVLKSPLLHKLSYEVEMPSLPIDQIRFMNEEEQNIWHFPRLYVNGSSWIWKYGLITKEWVVNQLESEIEEYESTILSYKEIIRDLKA